MIKDLKNLCSQKLKDSLSVENADEILQAAKLVMDEGLMASAQAFVDINSNTGSTSEDKVSEAAEK